MASGSAARVAVMKPAEAGERDDLAHLGRLDGPVLGFHSREWGSTLDSFKELIPDLLDLEGLLALRSVEVLSSHQRT